MEKKTDFAEFITDIRNGACHQELSEALNEVVAAVKEVNKMGTLKLTLKVYPEGNGRVSISDDVSNSPPKATKPTTSFFTDEKNRLSRDDPRQLSLNFQETPEGKNTPRQVTDEEPAPLRSVGG